MLSLLTLGKQVSNMLSNKMQAREMPYSLGLFLQLCRSFSPLVCIAIISLQTREPARSYLFFRYSTEKKSTPSTLAPKGIILKIIMRNFANSLLTTAKPSKLAALNSNSFHNGIKILILFSFESSVV